MTEPMSDERFAKIKEAFARRQRCFVPDPKLTYELFRELQRLRAERESSWDREQLGQLVRMAWVEWAKEQDNPKPSWLVPWEELPESDKEADRRIGEFIASKSVNPEMLKLEAENAEYKAIVEKLPVTADGVVIEPGNVTFCSMGRDEHRSFPHSWDMRDCFGHTLAEHSKHSDEVHYSTREVAEAAQQQESSHE